MTNFLPLWAVMRRALGVLPDWAKAILKVWLVTFWRLGATAKIVVTAAEIVVLYLALPHIPLASQWREVILEFGSLGLCFLLIAGILFGSSKRTG